MEWIENLMAKNNGLGWEDQYRAKVTRQERRWKKKSAETSIATDNLFDQ
jgi:hypothetical protein